MPLFVFLEFGKPQFFTDFVVADTQLLNLFVRHVYFFTGFKTHTVDDTVRVNVFAVNVRADQHLTALEILSQSACRLMRCARVDGSAFRETLYHVVEHHAAVFVM